MAKQENSSRPNKLEPDELVQHLVQDASHVPDVRVLGGFLGKSNREGYWRLYLTPTLNEYVEFAEDDVVHSHTFESDESQLGGTVIWVRREANLQHTRSASREAQADFLQGAIAASVLGCGHLTRACPDYVQLAPQQANIFLSFAGHANSCVSDICNNFMAPSFMGGGNVFCTKWPSLCTALCTY
jgi:hypothetical protein